MSFPVGFTEVVQWKDGRQWMHGAIVDGNITDQIGGHK